MPQPQHSDANPISKKLLQIYLADHLAGSTAGCGRMSRMAAAHADTPHGDRLSEISSELQTERAFLQQIMRKLRLGHHPLRQFIAWAGERLGRLKGNGRLVTASPLTLLLELEIMRSAVAGKLGLWQTLQANAEDLRLDAQELEVLIDQTRRQADNLERLHEYARLSSIRLRTRPIHQATTANARRENTQSPIGPVNS